MGDKMNNEFITIGETKDDTDINKNEEEQEVTPMDLKFAEQIITAGAVFENIVTDTEKTKTSAINDKHDESTISELITEKTVEEEITNSEDLSNESCELNLNKPNLSDQREKENSSHVEEELNNTDNVDQVENMKMDCSIDEGFGSELTSSCNEEKNDVIENAKEDLTTKCPSYDRQMSEDVLNSNQEVKLKRLDTMDYISDDEDSQSGGSDDEKDVVVHKKK